MRPISTQSLRRFWIILVCGLIAATWLACLGEETVSNLPTPAEPDDADAPAAQPDDRPAGQEGEAEWTVMLYQDADDEILEQDIMLDFNEAELFGSSDQVNIVAQVDRYKGAFKGMGNWTSTKRFYITEDNNLKEIRSTELADLGELNMADRATLVDFITWAVENYPARKYALIMSDHGAGWPGGWNDPDPGGTGPDRVAVAQLFGVDGLWLMELDQALEEAQAQTGLDKFDLIGFDACLMAQLEVFTMLEPYGHYAVASQEVEPALGWAYASFLAQLVKQPEMDGAGLAQLIVSSYIDQDLRILDDESRQELLAQEFNFYGQASAEEVAEAKRKDVTLTAVDLSAVPALNTAVDNLATALVGVTPKMVAQARAYAQSFQSIFGEETPSPYIDLGHFTQLLTELNGSEQVVGAANQVGAAIEQATIAEKHGSNRPGATGFTIYFPTSEIYNTADNVGYTTVAARFADISKWDDFLAAFYTGRPGQQFNRPDEDEAPTSQTTAVSVNLTDAQVAQLQADILYLQRLGYSNSEIPQVLVQEGGYPPDVIQALIDGGVFRSGASRSQSLALLSPKPIQLTPLTLSTELASPTEPVTISTEISGDRLAYLYTFIGRLLPREDALIIEDIDYVFADETQEIGGVQYPVWPAGSFPVEFTWEPTVYAASDGTTSIRALFEPVKYDPESPTYSLGVTYHPASGGDPRFAKIYFRDDRMTEIFGFTSGITQAFGAPRQILPQPGDQFTVLEKGDDLSQGDAGREKYIREAGTLTFNGQPFTLETTPAPSGNYVVGFIAEDLDGQTFEQYEGLFVLNEAVSSVDGFAPFVSRDLGFALLYPEQWTVEENTAEGTVDFSDEAGSARVTISQAAFPDASSAGAANSQAIQQVIDSLNQDGTLENLQFLGDVQDYVLGAFDAQTLDFAFDLDGQPYYGYAVASTPISGTTYVVLASSLDAEFDQMVPEFDDMLYSFDILISGVSKEQAGPPPPDFAAEAFSDDFSDPTSGLIADETEQDWGRGYYSEAGQYIFELKPDPGAIYDYYPDQTLSADFLIQASASYTGGLNNAYGLIFRVQAGQERADFYTFRISGDGFYSVEKTEEGELIPLIDWTASALINQAAGAANVLTVQGQGDTYRLYLNGRQVDSFSDASYSGGSFGFMVDNYDQAASANFSFDDVRVGAAAE